jgi:hypothetical protein
LSLVIFQSRSAGGRMIAAIDTRRTLFRKIWQVAFPERDNRFSQKGAPFSLAALIAAGAPPQPGRA